MIAAGQGWIVGKIDIRGRGSEANILLDYIIRARRHQRKIDLSPRIYISLTPTEARASASGAP
jgi:hypothetical protein